jgi:hypothetical protein
MEMPHHHKLSELFKQLGLPHNPAAISEFCARYRLGHNIALAEASFWNESQKQFLREAWQDDSDWVEPLDELAARLRH